MNECVLIFPNEVAAGQQRWMAFHYNLPKPAATLLLPTLLLLLLLRLIEARSLFRAPDPRRPLLPPLFLTRLNCAGPFLQPLSLPIPTPQCPLNPRRYYHPPISSSRYRPARERKEKKKGGGGGRLNYFGLSAATRKCLMLFPVSNGRVGTVEDPAKLI